MKMKYTLVSISILFFDKHGIYLGFTSKVGGSLQYDTRFALLSCTTTQKLGFLEAVSKILYHSYTPTYFYYELR